MSPARAASPAPRSPYAASVVSTTLGELCALALDASDGTIFVYPSGNADIHVFTTGGSVVRTIPRPGASSNDFDIDFAPEAFTLGATTVPAGSLLAINGDSSPIALYAVDPDSGSILAQLDIGTGITAVGGSYHPDRNTYFYVDWGADTISEISTIDASVIASFPVAPSGSPAFDVYFGDVTVGPSGNLFVVSSSQQVVRELTPAGVFVADSTTTFSGMSGADIDPASGEIWVSSTGGSFGIADEAINVINGTDEDDDIEGTTGPDLILAGDGDDTIDGGGGDDTIVGGAGADTLSGGEGDDTLDGGSGDDTLDGGDDVDTADYSDALADAGASAAAAVGVIVDLSEGTASGFGSDVLFQLENVIGSSGNDVLIGDANVNELDGRGGGDALRGSGAADSIFGGPGADTIRGLGGSDTLDGGGGTDAIEGGNGADVIRGGSGGDTLKGGPGKDVLKGQGGEDTIYADDDRKDRVDGGPARDRADVDRGLDKVVSIERFI